MQQQQYLLIQLRIRWTEHITNKLEVYQRAEKTRGILKTLKTKLIEHILCHNRLLSRIIEGAIEKKNIRGRPSLDYISQIV